MSRALQCRDLKATSEEGDDAQRVVVLAGELVQGDASFLEVSDIVIVKMNNAKVLEPWGTPARGYVYPSRDSYLLTWTRCFR